MAYEESFARLGGLFDEALKQRLKALAHDPDSIVAQALGRIGTPAEDFEAGLDGNAVPGLAFAESASGERNMIIEAIVQRVGRPSFLMSRGKVDWKTGVKFTEGVDGDTMIARVDQLADKFLAVGRVDVINHPTMDWIGTSWLVEGPGGPIAITNRHVAEEFATLRAGGAAVFRSDPRSMVRLGAAIDFRHEHQTPDRFEVAVKSIRYLARGNDPDIAILELESNDHLALPFALADEEAKKGDLIGTVGYPARDSRNDAAAQDEIFGTIYNVKRFAPGRVRQAAGSDHLFKHDAATLGGASGSPLIDIESGKVVGLHFSGRYLEANYAVSVASIKAAFARRIVSVGGVPANAEGRRDGATPAAHFKGRKGYEPGFLSATDAALHVPLPTVPRPGLAALLDDPSDCELRYTHFSILFDARRKSPRLAAVNIDGEKPVKIKRGDDKWNKDLRIDPEVQLGSTDFLGDFDRGHMVRREDPNWGDMATAAVADADTFHYTNAALQHALLNRNKSRWLGLEDYILRSAQTHGLRASVFTGPILDEDDPELKDPPFIQVPRAFWKIVVMVAAGERRLHATGYVLGQAKFIQSLTESFEYGDYNLYQVPIDKIEAATGIEFGRLREADPMARLADEEAASGGARLLQSLEEIILD